MIRSKQFHKKKTKSSKPINLKFLKELISESASFFKCSFISHVNPDILVQSIRQYIKIIKNIKNIVLLNRNQTKSVYKQKPILIYSDNKYIRQLLTLSLDKYKSFSNNQNYSMLEIGGIKQLISNTELKKKTMLVIFLDKPNMSILNYCITNKIYVLSTFSNMTMQNNFNGYQIPLNIESLKKIFWLVTLLETI